MPYPFEMHFHTAETSPCGSVPAADGIRAYHEHGYAGIVVTDHYIDWMFDRFSEPSWKEKVAHWRRGYELAREAGDACGLIVLCGMEFRFHYNTNDYLVYGDLHALWNEPQAFQWTEEEFSDFAHKNGLLFCQAHPFRPGLIRCPSPLLDGVEIHNGNRRHNSHNEQALALSQRDGLLPLAGADFHEWEDLPGHGDERLCFDAPPRDVHELVAMLRKRAYSIETL